MEHSSKRIIKRKFLPVVFVFIIFGITAVFFSRLPPKKPALALDSLLSCFTTTAQGTYTSDAVCLEDTVKQLMKTYPSDEIVKYVIASSTPLVLHIYAHPIAHFMGKQLYLKTGSVETALRECARGPYYGYGCVHGTIGAAIVKEMGLSPTEADYIAHANPITLKRIAEKYCADDNYQLCHAAGHIIFEVYQNYTKIPEVCDEVGKDAVKREACARGGFMESAGSVGTLSPTLSQSPLSETDYRAICENIDPSYQHACFWYLPWIQLRSFEEHNVESAERIASSKNFCEELNGAPRAYCIEAIGLNSPGIFRNVANPNRKYFCNQFARGRDRQACVLGVAESFLNLLNFPGGVNYCYQIDDTSLKNFCYDALFQISDQISMGSAMGTICANEITSNECRQKFSEYLAKKSDSPNYLFGLYGERQ
ncbi:MAG: hypothetical protein AAB539_02260 [Patescibacteria group bacterium]